MKLKFQQNIGMSVDIAVDNTAKNEEKKLLIRKIQIENEATENKLKRKLKLKQNIGMSVALQSSTQHKMK